MAEPDIVERLREAADYGLPDIVREAATEIERLRADLAYCGQRQQTHREELERLRGRWTRLGPGSLPPEGVPFECRIDGSPGVRMFGITLDGDGYAFWTDGERAEAVEDSWPEVPPAGWWRLLPGGEPPT